MSISGWVAGRIFILSVSVGLRADVTFFCWVQVGINKNKKKFVGFWSGCGLTFNRYCGFVRVPDSVRVLTRSDNGFYLVLTLIPEKLSIKSKIIKNVLIKKRSALKSDFATRCGNSPKSSLISSGIIINKIYNDKKRFTNIIRPTVKSNYPTRCNSDVYMFYLIPEYLSVKTKVVQNVLIQKKNKEKKQT